MCLGDVSGGMGDEGGRTTGRGGHVGRGGVGSLLVGGSFLGPTESTGALSLPVFQRKPPNYILSLLIFENANLVTFFQKAFSGPTPCLPGGKLVTIRGSVTCALQVTVL